MRHTRKRSAGIIPLKSMTMETVVADSKMAENASLNALVFPDNASNL